jgi:hypothetical protein
MTDPPIMIIRGYSFRCEGNSVDGALDVRHQIAIGTGTNDMPDANIAESIGRRRNADGIENIGVTFYVDGMGIIISPDERDSKLCQIVRQFDEEELEAKM